MYALVDLSTNQVVPQRGQTALTFESLARVDLPDGSVIFSPSSGYVFPPQYVGEINPPPKFKLLEVLTIETGVGPVSVDATPVFDGQNVKTARSLSGYPSAVQAARVRSQAEQRIIKGILVNGKPFRADDVSVGRMGRLANALAVAVGGTTQTFKTAAGDTFTVNAAQAAAISTAQIRWQGAILAQSAALQDALPANPSADANWPTPPSVILS